MFLLQGLHSLTELSPPRIGLKELTPYVFKLRSLPPFLTLEKSSPPPLRKGWLEPWRSENVFLFQCKEALIIPSKMFKSFAQQLANE